MNYLTPTCWSERGRFTEGQVERMLAEYEMYRKPMSSSLSVALNGTEFNATNAGGGTTTVTGRSNDNATLTGKYNDTMTTVKRNGTTTAPTAVPNGGGKVNSRWNFVKGVRLVIEDP
jgi:hypothetical protein